MALPTVGRVVHYHDVSGGEPWSAIVTAVHPTAVVDLTVFPPRRPPFERADVAFGDKPGQWSWPPRAEG